MPERKPKPNDAIDVALYGRASTNEQNGPSNASQFAAIRDKIRHVNRRISIVAEYGDNGPCRRLGGQRPGMSKLLRDIESGKLRGAAILVYDLARFARSQEIASICAMLHQKFGVAVIPFDSSGSGTGRLVRKRRRR